MLSRLPVELTFMILEHMHTLQIANFAKAVIYNHSMQSNVLSPCLQMLRHVRKTANRRAHFERFFGHANDFVVVNRGSGTNVVFTNYEGQRCFQMRHEYHTSFLRLDDTLEWLPPAGTSQIGADGYFAELLESEMRMLRIEAAQHGLSIPLSFFRLMSDSRLIDRLPHRFWLPARSCITKASSYISNSNDGYMIDFCHASPRESETDLWSLWLEPEGSHCIIRRTITSHSAADRTMPAAQLVGMSFELWLASVFFSQWQVCGVDPYFKDHYNLDVSLRACLSACNSYNSRL